MCSRIPFRWCACAIGYLLLAGSPAGASSVTGAYRLQAGEVIEITVAGIPNLSERATVQIDGTIMIPLIGTVDVGGVPWADVRGRIQSAFASRLLPTYGSDGRETLRGVERDAVAVSIAQYRPVWVSGDVTRSGEQAFTPQMTVRQAVAAAGGLRSVMTETGAPAVDAVRLSNDYATSWVRAAALAVRAWRLRTELGETADFDPAVLPKSPVAEETLARLLANERRIRDARQRDAAAEISSLRRAAQFAEEQIAVLKQQLEAEARNEREDQAEYERIQELLSKGSVTTSRVVDTRRLALFSATRKLETQVQVTQIQRQLEQYRRDLARVDQTRRLSALEELQRAEASLAEEEIRMQTAERQLLLAGMAVPRPEDVRHVPELTIIRRTADGWSTNAAGYEDQLYPGDVVEVRWLTQAPPPRPLVLPFSPSAPVASSEPAGAPPLSLAPIVEIQ